MRGEKRQRKKDQPYWCTHTSLQSIATRRWIKLIHIPRPQRPGMVSNASNPFQSQLFFWLSSCSRRRRVFCDSRASHRCRNGSLRSSSHKRIFRYISPSVCVFRFPYSSIRVALSSSSMSVGIVETVSLFDPRIRGSGMEKTTV